MKATCERCNGSGSLYTRIACDVHIADCPDCNATGQVELTQPIKQKKAEPYKSFGAVDLDSLLRGE